MKAEHRKELHTNVLADRMGRFMQTVRQRPQGRTVFIWVAVVVGIIVVVGWYFWSRTAATRDSEMWKALSLGYMEDGGRAMEATEYIIATYPNYKQADIARYERAWSWLWDCKVQTKNKMVIPGGIAYLKSFDSEETRDIPLITVKFSEEEFSKLYEQNKDDPILGPEALYNMAVAQETRAVEDIDKLKAAKASFKEVVEKYPNSARAQFADQRLKEWYNSDEKFAQLSEFYRELNKQGKVKKKLSDIIPD